MNDSHARAIGARWTCGLLVLWFSASLSMSRVEAASISWSAPASITSNLNIVNPCSVVQALDFGAASAPFGNTNVSVGACTVTFVPFQGSLPNQSYGGGYLFNESGTSVDASFDRVLDTISHADDSNAYTIPFTGLMSGAAYTLQVFTSDNGGDVWNTQLNIGGITTIIGTNGLPLSQFATASIVLGMEETGFDLVVNFVPNGPAGASTRTGPAVNAAVLSQAQVPEPAPLLLCSAVLGLIALFRQTQARSRSNSKRIQ
jgi:hypothetical protein